MCAWELTAAQGLKPSDRYAVSLCSSCHELQHRFGELRFWSVLRIDPLSVALRLWTVSGDLEAGERTVFRARQHISLMRADRDDRLKSQAIGADQQDG